MTQLFGFENHFAHIMARRTIINNSLVDELSFVFMFLKKGLLLLSIFIINSRGDNILRGISSEVFNFPKPWSMLYWYSRPRSYLSWRTRLLYSDRYSLARFWNYWLCVGSLGQISHIIILYLGLSWCTRFTGKSNCHTLKLPSVLFSIAMLVLDPNSQRYNLGFF